MGKLGNSTRIRACCELSPDGGDRKLQSLHYTREEGCMQSLVSCQRTDRSLGSRENETYPGD